MNLCDLWAVHAFNPPSLAFLCHLSISRSFAAVPERIVELADWEIQTLNPKPSSASTHREAPVGLIFSGAASKRYCVR